MMWIGKAGSRRRLALGASGWIALAAMSVSLLTGCGGSGGGGSANSQSAAEQLPGTWRVARLEAGGQSTACAGEINLVENDTNITISCGANDTVTFFENGAFTYSSAGAGAYAGTWQISGDRLTITTTTPAQFVGTETQRVDFDGDNSFTSKSEDGTTSTFERR